MHQNEIKHYGVKGMKWGIRRAKQKLTKATTQEQHDKAVSILEKHRRKATKKVSKFEQKRPKIEKEYNRAITKTDVKIGKLEQEQARLSRKANRLFVSDRKAAKLMSKYQLLDMRVKELKSYSDRAKAEMAKNERMIELFNRGISEIDTTLAEAGRKYING